MRILLAMTPFMHIPSIAAAPHPLKQAKIACPSDGGDNAYDHKP